MKGETKGGRKKIEDRRQKGIQIAKLYRKKCRYRERERKINRVTDT